MIKFIEITDWANEETKITINIEAIRSFISYREANCMINVEGGQFVSRESYEQVQRALALAAKHDFMVIIPVVEAE